ncbi:MAG TPA: 2-oxoacid:acceptor oxidoreductase subunit alpha [Anaerolineae bacterium]|nr:2-oxoacid:acceptor oxidoreductase subunit alpha [Anaerolineae bacterium]
MRDTLLLRLGGESGTDNVVSAGDVLTLSIARSGYHVHTFRTYPAEIRGGPVMFQLRMGVRPVASLGDKLDALMAFNEEAWHLHRTALRSDGLLVYDPEAMAAPKEVEGRAYAIPLQKLAADLNLRKGKNLVGLGALAALFGFDVQELQATVREKFGKSRPEFVESNRIAVLAGYQWVHDSPPTERPERLNAPDPSADKQSVMSGNQAIVAGALAAGCRFFAGYPITPASDILEEMAKRLPALGGACFQTEDEISAIGSVVGASIAGVKAMTATSGPGFSLMQEMLGLATMAEVPLVVVDSQRAGPSTGMPTKMEQSDLNISLYGGHGDAPRIVLAARSVEDSFYQAMQAFYLSETFQMPVVLLTDQSLAHRTCTLAMPNPDLVPVVQRLRPPAGATEYKRYELTESGVSPMGIPGFDRTPFTSTGLEHDEYGAPNYTPEMHSAQLDKRGRKFEIAADALCGLEAPLGCMTFGVPEEEATIGVLTWGSTAGVVQEAVEGLAAEGHPVAALIPAVINPLPAERVLRFARHLKAIIVPEVNRGRQFAAWVKAHTELHTISLTKYGGLPFTPTEVRAKILECMTAAPPSTKQRRAGGSREVNSG